MAERRRAEGMVQRVDLAGDSLRAVQIIGDQPIPLRRGQRRVLGLAGDEQADIGDAVVIHIGRDRSRQDPREANGIGQV